MLPGDGWYLFGPLVALPVLGLAVAVLWWTAGREQDPLRAFDPDRALLLADAEDYGLLRPAALAEDADVAQDVRRMLAAAGIRSTMAAGVDGQIHVLVFAEQVDAARRLVGGSPNASSGTG